MLKTLILLFIPSVALAFGPSKDLIRKCGEEPIFQGSCMQTAMHCPITYQDGKISMDKDCNEVMCTWYCYVDGVKIEGGEDEEDKE